MTENTLDIFTIGQNITLEPYAKWQKEAQHTFGRAEAIGVLAALHIGRPLLVRGEPGCGKTQLARAAAQVLGMPMAILVVNERTETEDLFWKYDALRRLSDANDPEVTELDSTKYLTPGPLWWALNHDSAEELDKQKLSAPDMAQSGKHPRDFANKCLLLIDEIDKADRAVPNSLLEALDDFCFTVPCTGERVSCKGADTRPLVVITTNNEQQLPPAFVRRCLVLDISLPADENDFIATLAQRGRAIFSGKFDEEKIFTDVAQMLWDKRQHVALSGSPFLPGQAEYLDHLAAILAMKQFAPPVSEQDAKNELATLAYGKNRF